MLTRALYVRDRFALPSALAIPPLDPPVESEPAGDVPTDAWDRWWQTLVDRETSLPMAAPAEPQLAALADAVYEDAHRWNAEHVTSEPPYDPRWVSTWLIDHRLTVPVEVLQVGVGGVWHKQVGPTRYLVSVGSIKRRTRWTYGCARCSKRTCSRRRGREPHPPPTHHPAPS